MTKTNLIALMMIAGLNCFAWKALPAEDSNRLTLTNERAIVFKDGYFMMVKSAVGKTDEQGRVFTEEVPDAAVLGSFWAIPEDGNIREMVAGWTDVKEEKMRAVDCQSMVEVLSANVGKHCSFRHHNREYAGTIAKVLKTDSTTPVDLNRAIHSGMWAGDREVAEQLGLAVSVTRPTGAFFQLATGEGDLLLNVGSVSHLRIDGMETTRSERTTIRSRRKQLTIRLDKKNEQVKMRLIYFRPGVRWIPTYRVDLTDELVDQPRFEKAKARWAAVSLQGELINEAEDLREVPIDVVVGVPNFRFKSVSSPLVLEATMRNALVQAVPDLMGQSLGNRSISNALYTQRSGEFRSSRAEGGGDGAPVQLPADLTSSGGNDLYVYSLPTMTLNRGERATVPIMTTRVPYRDVYTWDLHVPHSVNYAGQGEPSRSPLVLSENQVWRQVELINDSNMPWTTGAAMFANGFQPVAQELLTYTSPGGICRVPVTVAVDLRGKVRDRELEREFNALRWRGSDYLRVTGDIALELANNKTHPVNVEIRMNFGGMAAAASDDGEIVKRAYRAEDWTGMSGDGINNNSLVTWKGPIEPGECFKPSVNYHFYIRH